MAGMIERGNVMDPELAIFFLSELDGMIQSDMMNHAPEEIVRYTDQEQELILRKPHDGIYLTFLTAMIRQTQGEYEGYNNAMESFKEKLETFREWYVAHYDPAETASREYMGAAPGGAGYGFAYLTAYGLAVKHGYSGTEEEWLASLEGEPGAPGAAARMRFDAERGVIQWGVGKQWYDLFTIEELKDPIVEELMQEVRELAEQAGRDKEVANQAANTAAGCATAAGGHAKTAADAAADSLKFAGQAYTSEQNAVTAAGDAQVQAETAEGYAKRAEQAAERAEEAAANGGTGGNGSGSGQNVELDSSLTQGGKAADAKATGDEIKRVEGLIPSIEGLAKTEDIPKVPNWAMQTSKPGYTASEVGADPKGTAASALAEHNTATDAHNDIRVNLEELRQTLAHFFNATTPETMDQISELVSGIEANADLIAALTTGKVSVSSIVANLTTNLADRPLAASMGVELKKLIDQVSASLANYQPKGNYALASAVPTKVSQLVNDKGYLTEHQDINGKADKFDPTVYGLPVLRLTGDTAPIAVSKDNKVTLDYVWGERSGTCTLKGQGATSYKTAQALVKAGKAGKFNYTIKFDNAFEAKEGWGAQQKYCLKANFIDATHSRNICSCKQWGLIVKNRRNVPAELANLPNGGAIDGFPIVVMLNGEFHGLYTWNIPKDGWMFGLVEDPTKTQAVVGANDHELATQFKGELAGDESDFELEFVSDKTNTAWVATSLNRLINACINSTGADLDTVVGQYIDWDSAIDYLIHIVADKATDCVDKNFLLVTFDGTKWYFSDYDRDSIWGLNWDGSGLSRPVNGVDFAHCRSVSRLWELIIRFKTDRLKERYREMRNTSLAESKVMQTVENFAWAIPAPVMQEDIKRYPTIMGSSVATIDQIGRFVRQRLETVDAWVDELPAQEEPVEPDTPLKGNLVPTAIDTDGSIYNGTGYKDNTRLSSSGGVSGTAQNGSVVTGFIEFRPTDVIRMKGAQWLNATADHQGHYYLNFYDSGKAFISGGTVSSSEYAKTDSVYPVNINIMYDEATDVTTFDIVEGEWFAGLISNAAYFRINAYGKGEDLVITVNEEIV